MQFINLHTHQYTQNPTILEIVNQYPSQFNNTIPHYSIGIHPWYCNEENAPTELKIIKQKLQEEECIALGECGLDKRIETPLAIQIKIFEAQILLAQKYNKPIILHIVATFDELIEIKNRLKITVPMIIHGFSKNQIVAQQLIDNGFYLSFGKHLLKNINLETVLQSVPNNKFFLETDTIDQAIDEIYFIASIYKNLTLDELKKQMQDNYKNVFIKKAINF